jgi:hypothetical protein
LTIEMLDVPDAKPLKLEFPNASILQERGYIIQHDPLGGRVSDIQPNGQRRARLDLWEGCPSYAEFRKEGR